MAGQRKPIAVVSAFNLAMNLAFPVLAIRALGAGHAADALFIVFTLPAVVTVLLGNSVLNWVAPRLVRRSDDDSRRCLAWSLVWVLLAVVTLLLVLLWLLAYLLMPLLPPAVPGGLALAVQLMPVGILAVLVAVTMAVCQSLYTAERAVLSSELRTLAANLVVLLIWLLLAPSSLLACALLFTLRLGLQAVFLLPRLGLPRRADFSDRDLREVLRDSRALLLAASYYKSEPFVDRLLFASVSAGAVAAFQLATQLVGTVTLMMSRVVTATLVAPLAARVHAGDGSGARRVLRRALSLMAAVGLASWLLFAVAGLPLFELLFLGASPDLQNLQLAAQMLVLLGGYLLAILLGQVLAQMFYVTGDTRTVMWLGVFGYTAGLGIKLLALAWFGVPGLTVALSISWMLNLSAYAFFRPAMFRAGREDAAFRS